MIQTQMIFYILIRLTILSFFVALKFRSTNSLVIGSNVIAGNLLDIDFSGQLYFC